MSIDTYIIMKKLPLLILFLPLVFVPTAALAQVTLFLSPPNNMEQSETYDARQSIAVQFRADTRGETIGVIEGALTFPSADLEVISISRDNSFIESWAETPTVAPDTISFSGGIPGGFNGQGEVFTVVFETKTDRTAHVTVREGTLVLSFASEPQNIVGQTEDAWYPFKIPNVIPSNFSFRQNLGFDRRNIDVAYLQLCLSSEGIYTDSVTGYFSSLTREAVIQFQEAHFDEILKPGGHAQGTGIVDEATRIALSERCAEHASEVPPEPLFDISLALDETTFLSTEEFFTRISFTNFGREPTPVALQFVILDHSRGEVYRESETIIVQTEEVVTKTFEELTLLPGTYTLVVETLYNEDVFDKFRKDFTVVEKEYEAPPSQKKTPRALFLAAFLIVLIIVILRKKKRHAP